MTNLEKIERFKILYLNALDVNCERFSLVVSPDLEKLTELQASGALIMPIHVENNVFKIDVSTQQLCIIT
jgi:hypothetical protein